MKKLLTFAIFTIAAVIAFDGAEAQVRTKLRVGAILALTGDGASWGEALRNGMSLALEDLPPDTRRKLDLQYEDDAFNPMNTVSAFNKMLNTTGLDAVITVSSGTSKALAPIAEGKKVTLLAIASDPEICRGRKFVFNFWVTPEEELRLLLPEAVRRGYKNIARITSVHAGSLAAVAALDQISQGELKTVLDEQYPMDVRDFRSFIAKVRAAKNVDAILLTLLPPQLGIFARQAREAGLSQPFFGWETLEDLSEIKSARGALEGAWYVNAGDGRDSFMNRYRARFPESSIYGAANGYDAIMLFARALERDQAPNRLHNFLAELKNFEGVLGTYSATGDQRFSLPAALKVVSGTGFESFKD